ncbi:hypothetical protein [Streptomyces sp. NPDC005438]|uniref:hypothetical protein n=1 Tax=Streptomyces sp. NPDC005438 TaxID=3156880 RepID=UPI0033B311D9
MGWTYDFGVARHRGKWSRRRTRNLGVRRPGRSPMSSRPAHDDVELGIPHILRRRARWLGARLRHTRG